MKISHLNVFQKINYYLVFFLLISLLAVIFGLLMDLYVYYISKSWVEGYDSKTLQILVIVSIVQLLIIWPNAFTIYVHEMRKQLQPRIPFGFTLFKNICIISIVGLVFIPLIIYPFLTSQNSTEMGIVTKYLIEKRHYSIKTGYSDTVYATFFLCIICLPILGLINWFHALAWKGYVCLRK